MDHKVIADNGELLGESRERRGADIMAELFQLRGIPCRVESRRQAPVSRLCRLHLELLESRK
jgi:hypothetical protein